MKKIFESLKNYILLSKPRSVSLLFFTALIVILIASVKYGFDWTKIILISAAIIFGVMGANAATNFIDRKMDNQMKRTRKRPIPSGRVSPSGAIIFGIAMVAAGIIIAGFINYLSALFIFLGFLDSAIFYNLLTKKKSPLNILIGSPAGGMPILAGWAAIAGSISLLPLMLFLIVVIWTPAHIWSLSYFYKDDYKKAGVPMLPVIWKDQYTFILLAALNLAMALFSIFIGFFYRFSWLYMVIASLFGLAMVIISIMLLVKKDKKFAWLIFKVSSPYLAMIFILFIVEYAFFK